MSLRPQAAGRTRPCPHCRAIILESAAVCPACRHHLRFDSRKVEDRAESGEVALGFEGSFRHPPAGEPWEYSVVVVVRDGRGEELARKVVSVGALAPDEERSVSLTVEVFKHDT
jgi:uncharacterized protein YbaR (Trm112 family)